MSLSEPPACPAYLLCTSACEPILRHDLSHYVPYWILFFEILENKLFSAHHTLFDGLQNVLPSLLEINTGFIYY